MDYFNLQELEEWLEDYIHEPDFDCVESLVFASNELHTFVSRLEKAIERFSPPIPSDDALVHDAILMSLIEAKKGLLSFSESLKKKIDYYDACAYELNSEAVEQSIYGSYANQVRSSYYGGLL